MTAVLFETHIAQDLRNTTVDFFQLRFFSCFIFCWLFLKLKCFIVERTFLKKLPEPKGDEIKASTITISLDVTLPSGFTPRWQMQ